MQVLFLTINSTNESLFFIFIRGVAFFRYYLMTVIMWEVYFAQHYNEWLEK